MRRTLIAAVSVAGLGIALTACGDEDPTGAGSGVIGPGATTFEVVLDAEDFLLSDTTYDNLGEFRDADFRMVAEQFEGDFTAHTLFRITRPFTATYSPEGSGASRTDSIQSITGATLTLVLDTLVSTVPTTLELLPVLEDWHPRSVTWELRHDTAGDSAPWMEPGGTTGNVVGAEIWTGESDTVVIRMDSASAAVWHDTTAARRGALVRSADPEARVRIRSLEFAFDVIPEGTPDTIVPAGSANLSAHVANSEPGDPTGTELRVGGLPVWRSLLHFRPMDDLVVDACEATGDPDLPRCMIPIGDVSINLASLLLRPRAVTAHRVELPIKVDGRIVLQAEGIPLTRSPLAAPSGFMVDSLTTSLFEDPVDPDTAVAVPLTAYVRSLLNPGETGPLRWLGLTVSFEGNTYGYAAFSSMESAFPPRLRLVLTVPNEELYR